MCYFRMGSTHLYKHDRVYSKRRLARYCFNDFSRFSSVTEMLHCLYSVQTKLIALYKIIDGLLTVPTHGLVPRSRSLRSGYYQQPMTLVDAYKYSFFPSTLKL